jgi:hypothetical protein
VRWERLGCVAVCCGDQARLSDAAAAGVLRMIYSRRSDVKRVLKGYDG